MDENWENSIESRPSIRCHNGNLFVWKICPAVEEGKTNGEILKKAHEFCRKSTEFQAFSLVKERF